MAEKLDEVDWKILEAIKLKARLPVSGISRKTGLSRDVVKYRLQQLVKKGVINGFYTMLNLPSVGLGVWGYLHISFKDLTSKREEELIEFVKEHPNVLFAYSNLGSWDFGIEYCARDPKHFYELQKELKEKFSDIIKDSETGSYLEIHKMCYVPGQG
ncbi:MAG: Lrp/AsnC family transcriptional regulator [Candidatus Micrarchaeota archaeon]|nr:Lrp/AsnC family transcriptional regulator [Candidatus Micrarchaeota archaeon]